MKNVIASIALLVLLAAGRGGFAAEAIGWITYLDQKSDRFSLDDGRVFSVSEDINFASLKDGVRVRIQYDTYGNERTATDIELVPNGHPAGIGVPLCDGRQSKPRNITRPPSAGAVC